MTSTTSCSPAVKRDEQRYGWPRRRDDQAALQSAADAHDGIQFSHRVSRAHWPDHGHWSSNGRPKSFDEIWHVLATRYGKQIGTRHIIRGGEGVLTLFA